MSYEEREVSRHWKKQLMWEYDLLCEHYRIALRRPLLQIDEFSRYWGQYDPNTRTLSLHRQLIENYRWDDVVEILKHEMAHQIVFEIFASQDHTHGPLFQKACAMLNVAPWAARASGEIGEPLKAEENPDSLDAEEGLLRKARRLLALSQSDNEHESLLAMQRLQELSQRYNIDQLLAKRQQNYCYRIINHQKKRISQHQSYIANILQQHFFVDIVFSSEYDARHLTSFKTMEIFGSQENVQMAEYVYYYLWNQLPRMWDRHRLTGASGRQAKRAYYLGVLESFDEKLSRQKSEEKQAMPDDQDQRLAALLLTTNTQKALAQARAELTAYVRRRHPSLQTRHLKISHDASDSYHTGRRDGQTLNINPGLRSQNSSSLQKLLT